MNTPRQISLNVRDALEKKEFKRALSILEQGIAGLVHEPHVNYRDDEPLTLLRINQRIINSLDEQGVHTVGQLRERLHEIEDKLWMIGPEATGTLRRALRSLDDDVQY